MRPSLAAGARRRLRHARNIGRAFARLSWGDRSLLAAALVVVAYVRVALWLMPFPAVRRQVGALGRPRGRTGAGGAPTPERVGWAVSNAARVVPRASCLTQALAAQVLLTRRGHRTRLHLGVSGPISDFEAHAWLESDGKVVVGDHELDRYEALTAWEAGGPAG